MGLFDAIKKQLPKVIEWSDDSSDTIVYRYPITDRKEIMTGSQLTVRESQVAIFVAQGQIADVLLPGRHKLATENLPILTTIFSWKYAFESPYTGEIYFVNTKQFVNQKWGTSNPIMIRDTDFGMARIRAFGVYAFRVVDAGKLMKELSGTGASYKTEDVTEHLKKIVLNNLVDSIAESKIAILDLAANYREFGTLTKGHAAADFAQYGIDCTAIYIENISLPDDVVKALDSRTSVGMIGNEMGRFMQYQTAQAIPEAAKNPSGGVAGIGAGLGAGMMMMNSMNGAFQSANTPAAPVAAPKTATEKCHQCGAQMPAGSKFCPVCGTSIRVNVACQSCGTENPPQAKFCGNCGIRLVTNVPLCLKCGAKLAPGAKFCPDCGAEN
jgi:membrane protease subunit (stomatin/prohibitin family)